MACSVKTLKTRAEPVGQYEARLLIEPWNSVSVERSGTGMARILKRVSLLITSYCLLVVMTYQPFHPIFSNDGGNTTVIRHSSGLYCEEVAGSTEKRQNKSVVTIDRNLLYLKLHLSEVPYAGVGNYTRYMRDILGLKELTNVKAIMPNMGSVINDLSLFKYPISIAPCGRKIGKRNRRSVFISVMSTPNDFKKRSTIRQTWATHLKNQSNVNKRVDVLGFGFVIGLTNDEVIQQKVVEENELHGDMLQMNVYEEHGKLSLKTAGLLNWVNINCPQFDYLLKVDDDVYVNVHNLATVLYAFSPFVRSIYGRITGGGTPQRNYTEWPISFENWPWSNIPRYLHGGGVLIAGSAFRSLLAAIQTTPYLIKDDIYLTGLCTEKAGLQLRTSYWMFVDQSVTYPDSCFIRKNVMWSSKSEDHMTASHLHVDNFYRNATNAHCVLTTYIFYPNETLGMIVERKINMPATFSEFHFKSMMPQKWATIPTATNRIRHYRELQE